MNPRVRQVAAAVIRAFGLAVFVAGIALVVLAVLHWLQTARWQPITVLGALDYWPSSREWAAHPRSWQGLYLIVKWFLPVPVFIIVILLGAAIFLAAAPRSNRKRDQRPYM
jgi:hypothetical protein